MTNPDTFKTVAPNTFNSIALDPQAAANLPFADFVTVLLEKLEHVKNERAAFYEVLRRSNSRWANGSRATLALLGALAFLLTASAAALSFGWKDSGWDRWMLIVVLIIYAVMGTIGFYEKGTDKTTAYLRQVGVILVIRDLWTKLQFEVLKELTAMKAAADPTAASAASRDHILVLAQAFCADLDKAAASELTEWRADFVASLSELEDAAKKGTEAVTAKIQDSIKAAEKAATDAKAAAEKAAADAKAAAKSAEDAGKQGAINLTVAGDFDDQVAVAVDGKEAARGGKTLGLDHVPPGLRRISAQAKKGAKNLEAAIVVDVKPGLQDVRITLG
jgi:hypothetical protein